MRALQRAEQDLQQLVVRIAQRYVDRHKTTRRSHGHEVAWCWRELVEIEDQTFGDLGFQGRHAPEILASFYRLRDNRLLPADLHAPLDWDRDDVEMPAVVLVVRGLVRAEAMIDEA
ncbi:DUF2471 domain-containing protein [Paraburkholderia sp. MMS20-SJTN17]|uniref:DUF2471 domain-containing protein n=1 Tax=Paraburkholderia translucens TaxID=2886945 RepID=A0ABS8KKF6_9BURK|nr:DUF2471 family protein [Paraburkholderia sp. MMS20-SJTN17]MCC8405259.1 DUF2471 domain-containing protein [Paraburkholderia sp. MMS20-SJTN17]